MSSRPPISVYIMTFNEAEKIADAIASVRDWADEVVVVDSFSSDGTDAIARKMGARVEQVPFRSFGQIRNAAIAACRHDWIFSLDADERCTKAAAEEIQRTVAAPTADAYFIPRRNWYLGRWVMHSGWYPDYRQPQLFRRGAICFDEQAEVHEEYTIHGKVAYLTQEIIQFPFKDIEQMIHKMQRYSTLGAEKCDRQGKRGGILKGLLHGFWGFFRLYVLKLGFLDGRAGFIIALGNFEGTFYRYAKLAAKQEGWLSKPPPDPHA